MSKAAKQAQEPGSPARCIDTATTSNTNWDAAHSHANTALQLWESCSGRTRQSGCNAAQGAPSVDLVQEIGHLAALQVCPCFVADSA
jgi:hypothetical protein